MSLFQINFRDIVNQTLPHFLRKDNKLRYLFSAIKPLSELNNDGVEIESFGQKNPTMFQFELFIKEFLNFDAGTLSLERYLNRRWDPTSLRIKIVNDNASPVLYLFNDAEQSDPVFFYNNWDPAIAYKASPEDYAVEDNTVFKCIADNTNQQPPNATFWVVDSTITFLFNFQDIFPFDYRIEIPLDVTAQTNYSNERFKNQVRLFNSAGRSFEGVQLGNITNQFFNSLT